MMDENPDNNKAAEESGGPAEDQGQVSAPGRRTWKAEYVLPAVVLVVAVAGGVYLDRKIDGNRQAVALARQNTQALQADIRQQLSRLDESISRLASDQDALQRSLAEIARQQPKTNEEWALSEAEYLLVIASHRLLLERDVNTAISAMEAASSRLQSLSSPDLIPVREQLTADMNRLRAVNTVDTEGLAIYLADLVERAADLPVKKTETTLQESASTIDGDQPASGTDDAGWRDTLRLVWEELKSLVVIRKSGEIRQALLMPDEEYFLMQNLRLELENARLAVLRHDSANLHASITLLLDWLERYYDTTDAAVANIMDTLSRMATLELRPEVPDISSSLETLRAYMRQQ